MFVSRGFRDACRRCLSDKRVGEVECAYYVVARHEGHGRASPVAPSKSCQHGVVDGGGGERFQPGDDFCWLFLVVVLRVIW